MRSFIIFVMALFALSSSAVAKTCYGGFNVCKQNSHKTKNVAKRHRRQSIIPNNTNHNKLTSVFGFASYYKSGSHTASGERFDPFGFTAASRTLKFGARIRVTNISNGRSVVVRINDRGPFVGNRIIDVSYGAARELGMVRSGITKIRYERVD